MKPTEPDHSRLLLVGESPRWHEATLQAAAKLNVQLDVVADVRAALTRMLKPNPVYGHVLAETPISCRAIDALAGMLDEVTQRPTPLVLLGCATYTGANAVRCLATPDPGALCEALRRPFAPEAARLPPLTLDQVTAALYGGGLRVRFQPIVSASDLRPIGVEALSRVHMRERGIVHPRDFIPALVAGGCERVLTAIAAARTFLEIGQRAADTDWFASVNLPLATVMHDDALLRGVELCAVAGVPPSRILLEVLEAPVAPDLVRLGVCLERWRRAGFRTAIDDAGPALSYWRQLLDLPFDVLKLDGAMVVDPAAQGLMETIVAAARASGKFITAEGIEDEACLDRVRPLQVDALQGFLFARPLPAMALPLWLDQRAAHGWPAERTYQEPADRTASNGRQQDAA